MNTLAANLNLCWSDLGPSWGAFTDEHRNFVPGFDDRRRGNFHKRRAHCIEVMLLAEGICEPVLSVAHEDGIVS